MKASVDNIAKTLYEMIKDLPVGKECEIKIDKFNSNIVKLLVKNNLLGQSNQLIKKFSKIYNNKEKIIDAKVFSNRKLTEIEQKKLKDALKRKFDVKNVVIKNIIDQNIIGGFKIQIEDLIIDHSIGSKVKQLQKELM